MKYILIIIILVLSGCDFFEDKKPIKRISYEEAQKQKALRDKLRLEKDRMQIINNMKPVISSYFKDPDALIIDKYGDFEDARHGRGVCFYANAKNSYGGYNRYRWYIALPKINTIYSDQVAHDMCTGIRKSIFELK